MSNPQPSLRLAPITSLTLRNPRILLVGAHQPTLLRYIEGWPRRWSRPHTCLIRFAESADKLHMYASDSFDFVVVHAPEAGDVERTVGELVRVARQGLITRQ